MSLATPESAPQPAVSVPTVTPRIWAYVDRNGAAHPVVCPSWCENGHEGSQEFGEHPSDISHHAYGHEATVRATDAGTYEDWRLLSVQLAVGPDDEDPARRTPHVLVELVDDVWSQPMGPDELAVFIGTVEGQLAELRKMHARLVQARAEYRSAR